MVDDKNETVQVAFVMSDAHQCPECGNCELDDDGFERDGQHGYLRRLCGACGHVFNTVYKLTGFSNI